MMDAYVMINGQNKQKEETLKILNVKESSIERFRDCGIDKKKSVIWVLARTGSTNAFNKSNKHLESVESYLGRKDDTFDNTYEIIFFSIPVFKNIANVEHYPIPNIKEVVQRGVADIERGKVPVQAQNTIKQIKDTINDKNKNGVNIISLLDEN